MCLRLCAIVWSLLSFTSVWSHESITTEARKNYLAKLQESYQVQASNPPAAVKAKALYQIGATLEPGHHQPRRGQRLGVHFVVE